MDMSFRLKEELVCDCGMTDLKFVLEIGEIGFSWTHESEKRYVAICAACRTKYIIALKIRKVVTDTETETISYKKKG